MAPIALRLRLRLLFSAWMLEKDFTGLLRSIQEIVASSRNVDRTDYVEEETEGQRLRHIDVLSSSKELGPRGLLENGARV